MGNPITHLRNKRKQRQNRQHFRTRETKTQKWKCMNNNMNGMHSVLWHCKRLSLNDWTGNEKLLRGGSRNLPNRDTDEVQCGVAIITTHKHARICDQNVLKTRLKFKNKRIAFFTSGIWAKSFREKSRKQKYFRRQYKGQVNHLHLKSATILLCTSHKQKGSPGLSGQQNGPWTWTSEFTTLRQDSVYLKKVRTIYQKMIP